MILDQFKLDGKVAVVTGAGRGIGQAYALGLAEAGADIAIVDVIDMTETAEKVKALGRKVLCVKADLSKGEKESPKIVAKVVKALGRLDILVNNAGRLDILVNNAGIIRREPFVEHSAKNWNDVISINLSTPFFLSQAAARQMIAQGQGGKIINIGSMLSFQGGILIPGYAAAKGGIKSLTMLMANELSKHGICVNAIAPKKRNKAILDRIPAGRWGTPDDLKGLCVFLASPASDYVTGFMYACDGGWLAR